MAISFTLQPYSGYTVPVIPVYNDQTHLLYSNEISRNNYSALVDVNINDTKVGTLKRYPINGVIPVDPQKISENYLLHDLNYNVAGAINNPNSLKKINLVAGESYSRVVNFSALTATTVNIFNYLTLLTTTNTDLRVDDRIYIKKDNTLLNPQYNTYAKILNVTGNQIVTDLYWSASTIVESGILYEGIELFDTNFHKDGTRITTTNTHRYNVNDQIFLQMDTWSVAIIKLTGGSTGLINSILVNGVDALAGFSVPFNTSPAQTASDAANTINAVQSNPDYTAFNASGDPRLFIYSRRELGTVTAGQTLAINVSGDITYVNSNFFNTSGIDSTTNTGWNPQISGSYQITEIIDDHNFVLNIPSVYFNPSGSERGSIYSQNNYVYSGQTTGSTYYIMNNGNNYYYPDYSSEIAKRIISGGTINGVLTNQSLTDIPFYSLNDINTFDVIYDKTQSYLSLSAISITVNDGATSNRWLIHLTGGTTTYGFDAPNKYSRISYGFGAWNINNIPYNLINNYLTNMNPTSPIITDNTTSYTIDSSLNKFSFKRKCFSKKYFQIVFLNKWGAYDYYPITGNYQPALNIERNSFEKKREYIIDSTHYGFTPINRGTTVFDVKSNQTLKLFTDWLSLDQSNWLQEIFESSEVYIYSPTEATAQSIDFTNFYPVDLLDTQIILPNERSSLKMFEINVTLSSRRINQGN